MKKFNCVLLLVMVFICSCGPSKEEIEQQHQQELQQKEEAIRQEYEQKQSLQNSINEKRSEIGQLQNGIAQAQAQLEVEYDNMNQIKQWQLGRTQGERQEQISRQSLKIQRLQNDIQQAESSLVEFNSQLSSLETAIASYK